MNKLVQVTDFYKTTIYLNPDLIGRVDEVQSGAILYLNLPKPVDGVILDTDEWNRLKPMLVIAQSGFEASAEALKPSTTPAIEWVRVEIVERDSFYSKTTNSRRAMWRLITDDGT